MRLLLTAGALVLLTACSAPRPIASEAPAAAPVPVTTTTTSAATPTGTPAPGSPAPEAPPMLKAAPPCTRAARACVDLSENLAWLMRDGTVEYGPVPVTHGRAGHRTPTGTFPVAWKDAVHTSSVYGTPMPNSVFFAPGGIAFHEGSLTEESHGCVHLSPEAAKVFFDALPVRAVVQVVT